MIKGYPDLSSVCPGNSLILHVSTDAPAFRVDFYRQGTVLAYMAGSDWQPGQMAATPDYGSAATDWGWPGYEFPIPEEWPSGAYIAMFVERDANGNERLPDESGPDGRDAKALFVVRSAKPGASSSILYKVSLLTYHAYNFEGKRAAYCTGPDLTMTLRRPGGGTGGEVTFTPPNSPGSPRYPNGAPCPHNGNLDFYDPYDPIPPQHGSPRQTFTHWDAGFIAWLEANGYMVDYCTDVDIHADLNFIRHYQLLLSVGHDEYWSDGMRTHVESFISSGGNVAFFSGNTCWSRVSFLDGNTAFHNDGLWSAWQEGDAPRPENGLTGVSYRNAGGWWLGARDPVGFKIQNANHWILNGTGLRH